MLTDDFRGDSARLVRSIEALLNLDEAGALVPHGIGGHARSLLSAAATRLTALSAQKSERDSVIEECAKVAENNKGFPVARAIARLIAADIRNLKIEVES